MAAAIKAINAKIRSNKVLDYVFSTRTFDYHVWIKFLSSNILGIGVANCVIFITSTHLWNKVKSIPSWQIFFAIQYRLLGPSLQLRYPLGSGDGHAEGSWNVRTRRTWTILFPPRRVIRLLLTGVLCDSISGRMTAALTIYSGTFMRYALAVQPKNYLLFLCHFINFSAQVAQGYRYLNYWKCVPFANIWCILRWRPVFFCCCWAVN